MGKSKSLSKSKNNISKKVVKSRKTKKVKKVKKVNKGGAFGMRTPTGYRSPTGYNNRSRMQPGYSSTQYRNSYNRSRMNNEQRAYNRKVAFNKRTARNSSNSKNKKKSKKSNLDDEDEKIWGCVDKKMFDCKGQCVWRGGLSVMGGKCVPKVLSNELACYRRTPEKCVAPCRIYNSSGSRSRANCKHYPIKNVKEITRYVKEISLTKDKLLEYYGLMLDKNKDITKWIEDTRSKLLREIELQEGIVKKMKREQRDFVNLEEKNIHGEKIQKEDILLDKLVREEKETEDLLRQVSLIDTADKKKDLELEEKIKKEERVLDTRINKSGRIGYRNNKKLNQRYSPGLTSGLSRGVFNRKAFNRRY